MAGNDEPVRQVVARTKPSQPRPLRSREPRPLEAHVEQLSIIGEIMMGAAYADGEKAGIEIVAICEQLKEFVEAELLPSAVKRRLDHFDPATFDVEAACKGLSFGDEQDRLAIVRLVATVTGADAVMYESEVDYLRRVAVAIGLNPDQLRISLKR
jgi:uncharacterized tellurite resistance protein B-like protein